MVTIKKNAIVPHSSAKLFELVDRVEDYPDFLPWCGDANVITRTNEITRATILINYKGVKQTFTTENVKTYPKQMLIKLIDGPFKKLEGRWQFIEIEAGACRIELELHYEFSNIILDKLISPVFNMIANTFIDNFVAQANKDSDA
jgi:ribosome-associated toxin RatA of RatAB toxin-antitoxin module